MEDDAIQTDVSQEEEKQPVLSERELAMQAISDQLEASRQPEPQQEDDVPPAEPEATPVQTVRVKVDGEERELPIEEVVKGYQKDTVASKRLEEAAKRQRELEAREAALAERERQIQVQVVAPPPPEEEDDDTAAAVIAALEEGDGETAAKLLKDALKKGRQPATPAVNADEIAARVSAEVEAKQVNAQRAREWQEFQAANPLFADPQPDEQGMVIHSKERVRGDYLFANVYGPQIEAGQISYREALNKTAEHVAREFAPAAPPNPREERKKTIDNLPTASSARVTQSAKPETVTDVIEEMKKQRGQL